MVWNMKAGQATAVAPVASTGKKVKIAVGMSVQEEATHEWFQRMYAPLFYGPCDWAMFLPLLSRGVPQSVARDQIVEMFLADKEFSHLLWLDSDAITVAPVIEGGRTIYKPMDPKDSARALYNTNGAIVSGLIRAKQAIGFNYAAWLKAPGMPEGQFGVTPIGEWTGNYFPVDCVSCSFLMTKREVYEKVQRPWFPWPNPAPSEDFNFCIKAKEAGFSIKIFTEVKLSHIGLLAVQPDGTFRTLEL